ncbi:MAG TPA: potassium channel family protein [Nocardioidaceae bacterium]|nr:potassium channel family protein [Nocardioidaceae bacterium]
MTQSGPSMPASRPKFWTLGLIVGLRVTLSISVLFAAYFLIPIRSYQSGAEVPWLILQLAVFGVVVGVQVPAIVQAKYPILRAVEAATLLVPAYLLIFARIYVSNSLDDPSRFSRPLDDVTGLYFTVTVFSTVGFGDIVAKTDSMRMLVTVQMLLNLIVLGVVVRLLTVAARRGVARRGGQPASDDGPLNT